MGDLILGLDIGTSSVKCLLIDTKGSITTQAELPNQPQTPKIGWAEQATHVWQENVISSIRRCAQDARINPEQVSAIGVSGMVPALVILDEAGNVLRPAIQYNDARARREIEEFTEQIGPDRFFRLTGASLSAQSIGPKWVWLQRHEPDVCKKAATLMGSYDWLNFILTGERRVEQNWALESGLYELCTRKWSGEMLETFEIETDLLPPILQPTDLHGRLRPQIAEQCGLRPGIPVVGGSADHVAAALAAGINHAGDVLIKFGSSGDILYCSDEEVADQRLYLDYHNIPGKYLPNGCMATSGSLLKWVVEQFCEADSENAARQGVNHFDYLNELASTIEPGSDGVIVLPYFLGAKTPLNNPQARGVIYGLTLTHNRHHIYRAVLEAVTYGFRHHIEVLRSLGLPIRRIVASEGGARSPLWRQIAADVLKIPVQFLKDNPGSAYGAAIVAGMGAGLIQSWDVVEQNSRWGQEMQPDENAASAYDASYGIYREIYADLRETFRSTT